MTCYGLRLRFFTTDLLYEDEDVATSLGCRLGVPMPAANPALQILATARCRRMNGPDNACIVKLLEDAAGVTAVASQRGATE